MINNINDPRSSLLDVAYIYIVQGSPPLRVFELRGAS